MLTIEPYRDELSSGFAVYRHDTYPRGSVLAGQSRRAFVEMFESAEAAQTKYPQAETLGHSTKTTQLGGESLADHSGLPSCPPAWFDPTAAGERWDDDY